jgi:carbon monoxide dehydrogenase subunit G
VTQPAVTFHFERAIEASAAEIGDCLLDPTLLARSVPGAFLAAANGNSVTGRIRIKQAALPSVYALQAELNRAKADQPEETAVAIEGVAEEQRTGRRIEFRMRAIMNSSGPGRSYCRVTAELPAGDDTQILLDRLMPQFVRRLEDVARERREIAASEDSRSDAQEPARRPVLERFPLPWAKVEVAGAVASATAVAVIVAWGHLRRRRRRASPS